LKNTFVPKGMARKYVQTEWFGEHRGDHLSPQTG